MLGSVSLCVVARNEADVIEDCIRSASSFVGEVVVVDTGSADGTAELAAGCGARVYRHEYPGDQAGAFDLPLGYARGDWILVLDADEVLGPEAPALVEALIRREDIDGFLVEQWNYCYRPTDWSFRFCDPTLALTRGALGYVCAYSVRLFRRRPWIRNSGSLHQTVKPSIIAHGGRIERVGLRVHHYGYLRSHRAESKRALYRGLVERQAQVAPQDPRAHIELGTLLLGLELYEAARSEFQKARELGYGAGADFFEGLARHLAGEHTAACALYQRSLARIVEEREIDFRPIDAWRSLGVAQRDAGLAAEARESLRHALRLDPSDPLARNDLAALLVELGELEEAEAVLRPLLEERPSFDAGWSTHAALLLRLGRLREAERALDLTLELEPRHRVARINRALLLAEEGDGQRQHEALAAAREGLLSKSAFEAELEGYLPPRVEGGDVPPTRGGIVALIPHLHGAAARCLVDLLGALVGWPRALIYAHGDAYTGTGFGRELLALGVSARCVRSDDELRAALCSLAPRIVIHCWWPDPFLRQPSRVGDEPWVALGQAPLPMPAGYDLYVAPSRLVACRQPRLEPGRLRVIEPGCWHEGWPAARRTSRPVTITMLARMEPGRFPRRLIFHLPPLAELGARLVVAGQGPRRHEISRELGESGLARAVSFVGPITAAEIPAFLGDADIGLHLVEMHEPATGMAVREMLAAGLPVVAQPRGCLPEIVEQATTGFLAEGERAIAEHLTRLIVDPAMRHAFGASARERAMRNSLSRYQQAWRELVEDLATWTAGAAIGHRSAPEA